MPCAIEFPFTIRPHFVPKSSLTLIKSASWPWSRSHLQSFPHLLALTRMCRHHWAAWISRSHLQSLGVVLFAGIFVAFQYACAVVHDYALRIRDVFHDILSGIDELDASCAIPFDFPGVFDGRICCFYIVPSSRSVSLLAGILCWSNISDSLFGD